MKLSRAQAKAIGVEMPPKKATQAKQDRERREKMIKAMCQTHGLPEPEFEARFNEWADEPVINPATGKPYQWRFDMTFGLLIAVEQVGGVWIRGHHSRGQDQIDDMKKMNYAQMQGWCVLQFTPQQIESGEAFPIVLAALKGWPPCPP